MNRILIHAFSVILLLLIGACIGSSPRKLSPDEQQQIKALYNQGQIASPQERRLIDCKIKSVEASLSNDPTCLFEQEKGQKAPVLIQEQERIDELIEKNLNDALDKVRK